MVRLLVVDHFPVVRQGLRQIFGETADIVVMDEADSGKEFFSKIPKGGFDAVLMDISLPDRNGLDILKEFKTIKPKVPILVWGSFPEEEYAVRVLKMGASGYLTKDSIPEELVTAVRKIAQGRKYVSLSLAEKLASDLEVNSDKPPHEALSDREYQVMCMIADGKRLKEISTELSLSIKTISTYRSRIMEKMKMKNNAELIRYAMKHQLIA